MRRLLAHVSVVSLMSLAWLAGVAPAAAQPNERTLFVSVLDSTGAPVAGLGPDAFVVREDGQAREVLRVARATQPIDLAVLVDDSQAVTPFLNDVRKATKAFVTRMARDGHNVALIGLADRPTILQDYVAAPALLDRAADRIFAQPGSGTTVLDAIVETARGMRKRDAVRRVIVVVTTEGTDFSNPNHQHALDVLDKSGAALYAIVLTQPGGSAAAMQTEEGRSRGIVLDEGSADSGGRLVHIITSMALADALTRAADDLEGQYELVYARPGALIPPRKVDVSTNRPGLVARGTPAAEPSKPPGD